MTEQDAGEMVAPVGDYEVVNDNRMPDASVRVFRMRRGQSIQRHSHRHSWQMYLVVSGVVEIERDGSSYRLEPCETLEVPVGIVHGARPLGDEAVVANVSVPPLRSEDQHPEADVR